MDPPMDEDLPAFHEEQPEDASPAKLAARKLLDSHAPLFWQRQIGRFNGRQFRGHDGQLYSLPDTLRVIERELRRCADGKTTGWQAATRDLASITAQI